MTLPAQKEFPLVFAILLLVIVFAYANTLHSPFQFDDDKGIVYNQDIVRIRNFTNPSALQYRHAVSFTFALNYRFGGLNPFGYHLANILLHACVSILVFLVLHITLEAGASWRRKAARRVAFAGALLFALNPVLSEAVAYITGRASALAAGCCLLSLYLFIEGSLKKSGVVLPRLIFFIFSMVAFFIGALAKETALTLPLAIIFYDFCFMRSEHWVNWKTRFLCFYMFLPVLVVLFMLKSSASISVFKWWLNHLDWIYALSQLKVICYAVKLFLFPIGLTAEYNSYYAFDVAELEFILSAAFWTTVIFLSARFDIWRSFVPIFFVMWFLIAISPTNSFIPREDVFNERNLYLPSFGLVLFISIFLYSLGKRGCAGSRESAGGIKSGSSQNAGGAIRLVLGCQGGFFIVGLTAILTIHSALLIARNNIYKSKVSFWEATYKNTPKKLRVLHNLTAEYLKLEDYEKALVVLKEMQSINPSYYFTHVNLARVYAHFRNYALAEIEFMEAIRIEPVSFDAHFNLGSLYASQGLYRQAKEQYEKALESPNIAEILIKRHDFQDALFNSARVYLELELYADAERALNNVLARNDPASLILKAQVYAKTGREDMAENTYRRALNKGDLHQDAIAHNLLGLLYLKQGKLEDALAAFERSASADSSYVGAHFNLAKLLLEEKKDVENALTHFKKALELNTDPQKAGMIEKIISDLEH